MEPRFSGSAAVGVATSISITVILENQGAIVQRESRVLARFYSGEGILRKPP